MTYHTPSVQQSPRSRLVGFPSWRAVSWPCRRGQGEAGLAVWGAEGSWVWVKPASAMSGALWPRRLRLPSPRACREGQAPHLLDTALFHSVGRDKDEVNFIQLFLPACHVMSSKWSVLINIRCSIAPTDDKYWIQNMYFCFHNQNFHRFITFVTRMLGLTESLIISLIQNKITPACFRAGTQCGCLVRWLREISQWEFRQSQQA